MSDFEQQYYENEAFWEGEMLNDPENQERFRVTADLIPKNIHSLADIGCGNGVFLKLLKQLFPHMSLIGVDRSEAALSYVTTNKQLAEINDLPFSDKSFDCVTCLEVIEHLPLPIYEKSLKELTRISGGFIIISVPFRENLQESHNQCPSCKSIFSYEFHLRSFNEQDINQLLDHLGFKCVTFIKLNKSLRYKWHFTFRKFFYPKQFLGWKSPICPICGYSESKENTNSTKEYTQSKRSRKSIVSYISFFPKLFWPKEERFYWIVALYKRN